MDSLFLVIALAFFLLLSLYFGLSASGHSMTVRKIIAGCGAIFFAIYGIAVPEARSESLIMTALALVIFYYLSRLSSADNARE